jgi:hypothetical protein
MRTPSLRTVRRVALAVLAAPLALTACGSGDQPTSTAGTSPSEPIATATAAASGLSAGGSSAVARCTGKGVKVDLILQPDLTSASSATALMQVTNTGAAPCTVAGWAAVSLWNAADQQVKVPAREVAQPGAPTTVALKPGTTASAGIKWTPCDKGSDTCPTGNTLKVRLSGDSTDVVANLSEFPGAEKNTITMSALQTGTLQPSQEGVVAW